MDKKPIILVACQNGQYKDEDDSAFDGARRAYTSSVLAAGGIPLILPLGLSRDEILYAAKGANGCLLCGGADVDPAKYNASKSPKCGEVVPERDAGEIALAKLCKEQKIPLFGTCRGIQVMNVALGGTLYQDIPDEFPSSTKHGAKGDGKWTSFLHEISIDKDSLLGSIINTTSVKVNSLHHQAVKDLAPGLKPSGKAPDGLVEGFELSGHPFFLGVQWHPEIFGNPSFTPKNDDERSAQKWSRSLFSNFVQAAKSFR